jgi:hypothetical protein
MLFNQIQTPSIPPLAETYDEIKIDAIEEIKTKKVI